MPTTVQSVNCDAAVVPAIPASTTRENANIVTSAALARSGANSLTNNSTTTYYLALDTQDGNEGTCLMRAAFRFTALTGVIRVWCRSAAQNRVDCYELVIDPSGTDAVTLTRRNTSTPTTIGTPLGDITTFATGIWYVATVEAIGTSIRVTIQRDSDDNYLKSDETWVATAGTRAIAVKDGTPLTGQGYAGIALGTNAGAANDVYADDLDLMIPKINRLQHVAAGSNTSGADRVVSFGNPVVAGNFIYITVVAFDATAVIGVSDDLANRYVRLNNFQTGPAALQIFTFYAYNINGGPCNVTVTTTASTRMYIAGQELSGVSNIAPIESWSTRNQTNQTSGTAGIPPINHDDCAVFALYSNVDSTIVRTAGTYFTSRVNAGNPDTTIAVLMVDDLYVNVDEDTPFTLGSLATYVAQGFALRPTYVPTSNVQAVPGQAAAAQYLSPTVSTWVTTPLLITYPNATTTGNLLTCCVSAITGSAGALTTVVTDNRGNTWSLVTSGEDGANGLRAEIWQCVNAMGGSPHIVTVTPDDLVYLAAVINEYTGTTGVLVLATDDTGLDATPRSGTFASESADLTIAVMSSNATPGATADYQNTIDFPQDWTNVWVAPALSQLTTGISVISFGDVENDPGQTLEAIWGFADTRYWAVTAAVLEPSTPPPEETAVCMGEDSMLLEVDKPFTREFAIGIVGLTINIQMSKNGAALADPNAGASTLTEIGRGLYKFALEAEDVDTKGSLGYALTDDATNTIIYGHVVDRVWEITEDIMTNPNELNFQVADTFGATFTQGGVIALVTDLTPLPDMTEPPLPPASDASLIDGLSWIFHVMVVARDETESLQQVYNRAFDTVIATSVQSDTGGTTGTYTHGPYLASS